MENTKKNIPKSLKNILTVYIALEGIANMKTVK